MKAKQKMETKTQSPQLVAYDYANQCWIIDPNKARGLRQTQIRDTLALLKSPSGLHYCAFCGIGDKLALIVRLENEMLELLANPLN